MDNLHGSDSHRLDLQLGSLHEDSELNSPVEWRAHSTALRSRFQLRRTIPPSLKFPLGVTRRTIHSYWRSCQPILFKAFRSANPIKSDGTARIGINEHESTSNHHSPKPASTGNGNSLFPIYWVKWRKDVLGGERLSLTSSDHAVQPEFASDPTTKRNRALIFFVGPAEKSKPH